MEISEIVLLGLLGATSLISVLLAVYVLKSRKEPSRMQENTVTIKDVFQNQSVRFDSLGSKLDKIIALLSTKPKPSPKGISLKTQAILETAKAEIEPKVQTETDSLILKAIEYLGGQASAGEINIRGISRATKFRKLAKLVKKGYLVKRGNVYHLKSPELSSDTKDATEEKKDNEETIHIPW